MKKPVLLAGVLFMFSLLTSCTTDDFAGNERIKNEELIKVDTNSIQENNNSAYSREGDSIIYQTTETLLGDPIVKPKRD